MIIVFATNNPHKIEEIKLEIGSKVNILSLADIGCYEEIPENAETLEGNASLKSRTISEKYKYNCFADDTGLEIQALGGRPGVNSARYAGEEHDHEKNMDKVLRELCGITDRKARFRTVISLIVNGQETLFEGIVDGKILTYKQGNKGFGYDPIFQPDGYDISFAEMRLEEKNRISHRGIAVRKLVDFLLASEAK
jgi:XTP/dITP diphosphohydrolase